MTESEVVTYDIGDGQEVSIEIVPVEGFVPVGFDRVAGQVEKAVAPAITAARVVLDQARELAPDTVQVKFGVKVTGTTTWLVARAATEANFEITLSWTRDEA